MARKQAIIFCNSNLIVQSPYLTRAILIFNDFIGLFLTTISHPFVLFIKIELPKSPQGGMGYSQVIYKTKLIFQKEIERTEMKY